MERALPSSIDYTKILPIAAGNPRVMRRTFLPVNGQTFTAEGNNIVRIEISANQFWDAQHSYLRFNVRLPVFSDNVAGNNNGTFGFDFGGGHGIIRRLRVEQAGNIIMDCNRYDRLLASILLPAQGDLNNLGHRSITENCRYNNIGNAANMTVVEAGATTGGSFNSGISTNSGQLAPNAAAPGPFNSLQFCIPLVGGLFSQSKLVPLQLLSSAPLTIEIELAPPLDVGARDVIAGNADALTDYTVENIRYIASLVETSPDVDAQVRMVQEMSGGNIVLNSTDYTHFNGNIAANATGQQAINVPARRKSMKSIFFVGASSTYAAGGAGGDTQSVNYNQSFGGNFNMVDYHVKIGSLQYPATPVRCDFHLANAPFLRGEAMMELSKCFGTTGSTIGLGILNTCNYAATSCDTANQVVGTGGGGGNAPFRFSPFGLDLEAFQRTAIESGVNTADRSTPITLVVNIGTAQEAINVDAFVAFDSLYYIDNSGIISVSH